MRAQVSRPLSVQKRLSRSGFFIWKLYPRCRLPEPPMTDHGKRVNVAVPIGVRPYSVKKTGCDSSRTDWRGCVSIFGDANSGPLSAPAPQTQSGMRRISSQTCSRCIATVLAPENQSRLGAGMLAKRNPAQFRLQHHLELELGNTITQPRSHDRHTCVQHCDTVVGRNQRQPARRGITVCKQPVARVMPDSDHSRPIRTLGHLISGPVEINNHPIGYRLVLREHGRPRLRLPIQRII